MKDFLKMVTFNFYAIKEIYKTSENNVDILKNCSEVKDNLKYEVGFIPLFYDFIIMYFHV